MCYVFLSLFYFVCSFFLCFLFFFFFFNDTATTEIYTLSLHDALPIWPVYWNAAATSMPPERPSASRSEEHTSELQSRFDLVCRLLLEKKKEERRGTSGRRKKEKKRAGTEDQEER